MTSLPKRTPLKLSAPQVPRSICRAAPKSSVISRVSPGWFRAKSQPWSYAAEASPLCVVPYMYQARTGTGVAPAGVGVAASNAPIATANKKNRPI
jgi:hypothetical protein